MAVGVDADPALDEATDAGSLVTMQVGAASRREADGIAAPEQIPARERLERRRDLETRRDPGAIESALPQTGRDELPAPNSAAVLSGNERQRALSKLSLSAGHGAPGHRHGAMHDENHARTCWQIDGSIIGQDVFVEPKNWMHRTNPSCGTATAE